MTTTNSALGMASQMTHTQVIPAKTKQPLLSKNSSQLMQSQGLKNLKSDARIQEQIIAQKIKAKLPSQRSGTGQSLI